MAGVKRDKDETNNFELLLKNAMWTCESLHFKADKALKYINSGMLGYKQKDGKNIILDGKPVPITISRGTYYRRLEEMTELPLVYKELREFAMRGYALMMRAYTEELATLHRMAGEIMLSEKEGKDKLAAIQVLVKDIIPTEAAFADMLKKISRHYMEPTKDPIEEQKNAGS